MSQPSSPIPSLPSLKDLRALLGAMREQGWLTDMAETSAMVEPSADPLPVVSTGGTR